MNASFWLIEYPLVNDLRYGVRSLHSHRVLQVKVYWLGWNGRGARLMLQLDVRWWWLEIEVVIMEMPEYWLSGMECMSVDNGRAR